MRRQRHTNWRILDPATPHSPLPVASIHSHMVQQKPIIDQLDENYLRGTGRT